MTFEQIMSEPVRKWFQKNAERKNISVAELKEEFLKWFEENKDEINEAAKDVVAKPSKKTIERGKV